MNELRNWSSSFGWRAKVYEHEAPDRMCVYIRSVYSYYFYNSFDYDYHLWNVFISFDLVLSPSALFSPEIVFVWLFRPTKHQLFCVCVRAHLCWFAYNIPLELAPFSSAISYFSRFARNFADGICLQSWCNSRYREQLKQHRSTRNQTGIITHWSITYTMIWNRLRLKHMTHFISVQRKWNDQWNWLIEML